MPHTDAQEACHLIFHYLPAIPAWPQLPKRSFTENMYAQFSEGFPGIIIESEHVYIDHSQDIDTALEQLYTDYSENAIDHYSVSADYALGLHAFLSSKIERPLAVKGQVTGPISWGLSVTDQQGRAIIYDETLADALSKHLRLKAAWQEKALSQISPTTIIFIDEPYLSSLGSPFVSLSSQLVVNLLEEILTGIGGIKGIHCCGNTDWALLLGTSIDILSFAAYNHAQSFNAYTSEVKSFVERGSAIAWGIIPNEEDEIAEETVASLRDRLEEAMAPFTREGIRFRQLIEQGLLSPSCTLSSLSLEAAEQALKLLVELSAKLRQRYM
jgi:methionine synthase II (cobalamin-independent)